MPTKEQELENVTTYIADYVINQLDGKIVDFEENAGSFYITTETGNVFFIMVEKCEKEEEI